MLVFDGIQQFPVAAKGGTVFEIASAMLCQILRSPERISLTLIVNIAVDRYFYMFCQREHKIDLVALPDGPIAITGIIDWYIEKYFPCLFKNDHGSFN